jgi:hypothetical protein
MVIWEDSIITLLIRKKEKVYDSINKKVVDFSINNRPKPN